MDFIYREQGPAEIAVTTVQSLLVIVNITGNSFVCLIIIKNKDMRTSVNYLLMNLAIADMTVATFLAPRYIFIHTFIHPDGVAGNILCRVLTGGNFAWVGAGASVFTLITIATERYFAVMYPFENEGKLSSRKLKVIISCSWIFGIILGLPQFIVKKFDKKLNWCVYTWAEEWMGNAYTAAWFLFTSFLPVTWMIVLYSRVVCTLRVNGKSQKGLQQGVLRVRKRVTLMVITVSAIFGVTWLSNSSNYLLHHFLKYSFLTYASASLLVMFNSAINPVLYALMSQRFRNKMKQIMRCTYRSGKFRNRSTGGHEIKGERGNSQVPT